MYSSCTVHAEFVLVKLVTREEKKKTDQRKAYPGEASLTPDFMASCVIYIFIK